MADDRLDRRRIELAVLDYRAAQHRRKWPLILVVSNGLGAIAFAILSVQLATTGQRAGAALVAVTPVLMTVAAVVSYRRWRAESSDRPAPPPEPTDFTGLGSGPTVAERMEHIQDEAAE